MKDEIIDYNIVEHLPDESQSLWTEAVSAGLRSQF